MKTIHKWMISAATVAGVATMGVGALHAATNTTATSRVSDLVSAIATKFNLNQSEVQKVFDDQRQLHQQARQEEMQAMQKARLDLAVKNGKITQAQEDLILAKEAEVKTFVDNLKDKSVADRQAAIKTEMDAVTQWAQANAIPTQYVLFGRDGMGPGMGRHGVKAFDGMGGMMGRGHWQK